MSIQFRSLAVGPLETNCYILCDSETRSTAIIDPGGEADRIMDELARCLQDAGGSEPSVEWILLTHAHADHLFCVGEIARRFSARIGMHEADIPALMYCLELAEELQYASEYVGFTPSDSLKDGQVITLGRSRITVIHTPGHSPGGVCYLTDAGVFCGDTIFAGSIGRTDFPGGSYEALISSIKNRLMTLDDSVKLYPGHGPATTVGAERRSNPYFQ